MTPWEIKGEEFRQLQLRLRLSLSIQCPAHARHL